MLAIVLAGLEPLQVLVVAVVFKIGAHLVSHNPQLFTRRSQLVCQRQHLNARAIGCRRER